MIISIQSVTAHAENFTNLVTEATQSWFQDFRASQVGPITSGRRRVYRGMLGFVGGKPWPFAAMSEHSYPIPVESSKVLGSPLDRSGHPADARKRHSFGSH